MASKKQNNNNCPYPHTSAAFADWQESSSCLAIRILCAELQRHLRGQVLCVAYTCIKTRCNQVRTLTLNVGKTTGITYPHPSPSSVLSGDVQFPTMEATSPTEKVNPLAKVESSTIDTSGDASSTIRNKVWMLRLLNVHMEPCNLPLGVKTIMLS